MAQVRARTRSFARDCGRDSRGAHPHQQALRISSRRIAGLERRAAHGLGIRAVPPVTPFLERIGLGVFGVSLAGLRIFSVLAQGLSLFVTALMARELGGGRLAQVTAALVVALSPLPMFEATEFQYSSFDYLWWVLAAYFMIRLLKTENPRWWLAIGAAVGAGLMTKYTMCFLIAGIAGRSGADGRAALSAEPVVLGRRGLGVADFSAKSAVADPS